MRENKNDIMEAKKMKTKILATLVCLVMVATAIPSVSAAATVLTTVDEPESYVMLEANCSSGDIDELLGLSLTDADTLYVSYYNTTGSLVDTSFTCVVDADEEVWFNVTLPAINATWRQVWFSDEAITDYDATDCALFVNETIDEDTNVFIITIPDGVTYVYDDYGYAYEDEAFTVTEDGDDVGNVSSYNYSSNYSVYGFDLSDDDTAHQLVVVTDDVQGTATAVAGKRVTVNKWYWFDTTVPYSMDVETGTDYNIFTAPDGYVAFNVYKDYAGMFGKYVGGKIPFRLTTEGLKYGTHKWYWPFSTTWTTVSSSEAAIAGIKFGTIEKIWLSEETGANDINEILRDYSGVITSKGVSTATSGLEYLTMFSARTPEAVAYPGSAIFG
jgi:hypothetical protein